MSAQPQSTHKAPLLGCISVAARSATAAKPALTHSLTVLVVSPDGTTVAVGQDDSTVTLWDAQGKPQGVLRGHRAPVTALTFSADSRTIASATFAGDVKVWDVASHAERASMQAHTARIHGMAFSSDGATLATAGVEQVQNRIITDAAVKLWDVSLGKPRLTVQRQLDLFTTLTFSPDGKTLAAGGEDCTVKLWNTTSGHLRTVLTGHTRRITGLGFTPDASVLVSASGVLGDGWWVKEGEIKFWDAGKGTNPP